MKDFMTIALEEAKKAYEKGEVPIGAVVVCDGKVISRGQNKRQRTQNAIHHAEIIAIDKACRKLKSWRLENCDLYVTLEPCPMCAGAAINARIKNVYFACKEKTSNDNLLEQISKSDRLNHKTNFVHVGTLEEECSSLLTNFFKSKR